MRTAMRWGDRIPRRARPMLEKFARHANPKIAAYAAEVIRIDAEQRRAWREIMEQEELMYERSMAGLPVDMSVFPPDGNRDADSLGEFDLDDEIPF